MKKLNFFRYFTLLSFSALVLAGCGKDENPTPTPTPDPAPAPTPEKPVKEGVYFLMEGNANSGQTGQLFFMAPDSETFPIFKTEGDIYAAANPGHAAGALLEDMFIDDGKMYLVSQKGTLNGGDGQIVILNAETLVTEEIVPSIDLGAEDNHPQHIAVAGGKLFIQYAVSDMETHSGIRVYNLATKSLASADIDGTYGEFGKSGAAKARMLVSRGKVYVCCGESMVVIDPASETIVKRVPFEGRRVKDIVKGKDGNLYAAVSGTFTTEGSGFTMTYTYTSKAKIVQMDHAGAILSEKEIDVDLPVMTFTPHVSMCASYTDNVFFFAGEYDTSLYRTPDFCRFDYSAGTLTRVNIKTTTGNNNGVMGYMTVDPWTDRVIVPIQGNVFASYDAVTCELKEYDKNNKTPIPFCAGVDCTKRFSRDQIDK